MGMDGPGLAQGRGEIFYISHTANMGFRILVTAYWEIWEVLHACVCVLVRFRIFEGELKYKNKD